MATTIGVTKMNLPINKRVLAILSGLVKPSGIIKFSFILGMLLNTTALYAAWDKHTIKEMVANEAARQNFSIPIALAVAEVESNFDPYARSHVDARGVMQILPKTAEEDLGVRAASLYNPRVNIRAGVRFLKHLVKVYDGRVEIALSHYNGGSRVRQPNGSLKVIPATKAYVKKVLKKAKKYRSHSLAKVTRKHESANKNKHANITHLAKREALDDFENGDPLMHKRLAGRIKPTTDSNNYQGNVNDSIINKLKNLVKYNQNRVAAYHQVSRTNDDFNDNTKTNMRRNTMKDLVSEWERL